MAPTSTERVRKHRLKRRNDKDTWMADKVKERERIKRYREKKKSIMNEKELEQQRKYERERKRSQRAKKKEIERSMKCQDIIPEEQPSTSIMTPQVLGKAIKRVKNALPSTPTKQIPIIKDVVKTWSPGKIMVLSKEINIKLSDELNKEKETRKKRVDALSEDQKREVIDFYKQDSISRILPGKKEYVSVKDPVTGKRTKYQKRILTMKLKEAYQLFKEEAKISIGFSTFAELRPSEVFPVSQRDHEVCMCMHHENIEMLLDGLNKMSKTMKLPTNAETAMKETICYFDLNDDKSLNCCKRNCRECGVDSWVNKVINFDENDLEEDMETNFYQWKRIEGKMKKELIVCDLLQAKEELISLLNPFALHVYTAQKQLAEFKFLKENLKVGHLIIHEDFAENFMLKQQGEIMAAHWNSTQVTLFTCIIYYRNNETLELEHKNYVVVSDDINHTKHAVFAFNSAIIEDLKQTVAFNHIHFWSDGCGAQFKNRFNMQNLMLHTHYYGVSADWNFFGTAHGKGAVDGLGAVVKRNVWLGILRKQYVINTAIDFSKVAEKETPNINIKYVSETDIQKCATKFALTEKWEGATAISGIHSMHFAEPIDSDTLGLWKHSCFSNKKDPDEKIQILCLVHDERSNSDACTELLKKSDWVSVMYDDY